MTWASARPTSRPNACSCPSTAPSARPLRDTTSYLWPLGFTYTEDREKKYREWGAPWPLIVFARGEGKTLDRVWPFFSHGKTANVAERFLPLAALQVQPAHVRSAGPASARASCFFSTRIWWSGIRQRNGHAPDGSVAAVHSATDHNGNQRLQILAPLEPLLPNNPSDRTELLAPLVGLALGKQRQDRERRANPCSGTCIGATPRRRTRKCSLLFGLFQYQSGPEGKRLACVLHSQSGKQSQAAVNAPSRSP